MTFRVRSADRGRCFGTKDDQERPEALAGREKRVADRFQEPSRTIPDKPE